MSISESIPDTERLRAGLFISFEGGERVGKSTQIELLRMALEAAGQRTVVTREPGGTDLGVQIRLLVQNGPEDLNPKAEALLYAADRSYHVATVIRPALEEGSVVLTDRYLDSSVAYQGGARGLGERVRDLSLWAADGLLPDLTFLLDADPQDVLGRRLEAEDRMERESLQFHRAVRDRFLELAQMELKRFCVIDATQPQDVVAAKVWCRVQSLLSEA